MEYRRLGDSGLKVSELCLGTMNFGDRTNEAEARRITEARPSVYAGIQRSEVSLDRPDNSARCLKRVSLQRVRESQLNDALFAQLFDSLYSHGEPLLQHGVAMLSQRRRRAT
jgi:hypothetical protein